MSRPPQGRRPFTQVDVFGSAGGGGLDGNPVAVVHDAEGLRDAELAAFARWTNLSETTFLLPPTGVGDERADYRLRIFTPGGELPFAGHPTLGSAHAWLEQGGRPASDGVLLQECTVGLVEVRLHEERVAFVAPPLLRSGPVPDAELAAVRAGLRLEPRQVRAAAWVDNGPGWVGLLLDTAQTVLGLEPDWPALRGFEVGVIGPHADDGPADFEVRALCPQLGNAEDPVTGSLNAGFAVWLTGAGLAPPAYSVRQGTRLQRNGDVRIHTGSDGRLWVGGRCRTVVRGSVGLDDRLGS